MASDEVTFTIRDATPDEMKSLGGSGPKLYGAETALAKIGKSLYNPEGFTENALGAAITAPAIAAGGAGLLPILSRIGLRAAAPAVGRVLTSGAIGAGQAAARGDSMAGGAGFDMAASALMEGLLGGAGRLAGRYAAPADALAKIKQLVGKGPDGPLHVQMIDQMVKNIEAAPDPVSRSLAVRNAVSQIKTELAPKVPGLGSDFAREVANARVPMPFMPFLTSGVTPGKAQIAAGARAGMQNTAARAGADALSGMEAGEQNVPIGLSIGSAVAEMTPFSRLAREAMR